MKTKRKTITEVAINNCIPAPYPIAKHYQELPPEFLFSPTFLVRVKFEYKQSTASLFFSRILVGLSNISCHFFSLPLLMVLVVSFDA